MIIQIMGAGALGCLIGYLIQKSGYNVVFVARGKQYLALSKKLKISGLANDEIRVKVYQKPRNADITFLTVKAYDTEIAAKSLSKIDCGIVCSLQNGLNIEEILKKYLNKFLRGVTTYASYLINWGHIYYAAEGEIVIGNKSNYVDVVFDVLRSCKINVKLTDDINKKIWEKAVVNAVINPITALCRVKNGEILKSKDLWELARDLINECKTVAKAYGYELKNIESTVKSVIIKTSENKSSMLQDIERGKRTEIDYINGMFSKMAKVRNLHTPINYTLTKLIKAIELKYSSNTFGK